MEHRHMKVTAYIDKYGTPKAKLAREIGIHRVQLYAYLDPSTYPDMPLSDAILQKIADFEGRTLRAVKQEWERKAAA